MHEDMLCAFCCQPTPHLQNYSSLRLIAYQENCIGHFYFVSACVWVEKLPRLDGFVVSLLGSNRLLLNVSLHSFIHRERVASQNVSP